MGESVFKESEENLSNLLYVATDEGITIINTNEVTPTSSENFGFSKHYGLKTSSNPKLNFKIFDGNNSNFYYLNIIGNLLFFVAKDTSNDTLYAYNRKSFNIRLMRTTSLPSRNISGLSIIETS